LLAEKRPLAQPVCLALRIAADSFDVFIDDTVFADRIIILNILKGNLS